MSIYEGQVLKYNKCDNTRPDPQGLAFFFDDNPVCSGNVILSMTMKTTGGLSYGP